MSEILYGREQVQALCERLGCWDFITESLNSGKTGIMVVVTWVIVYYSHDKFIAKKCKNSKEAVELSKDLMVEFEGPGRYRELNLKKPTIQ
ncbi:hypothetical protein CCP4SC76_5300009 [Gammaproteobacteria bacterium]